jgi:hypothetical protein
MKTVAFISLSLAIFTSAITAFADDLNISGIVDFGA